MALQGTDQLDHLKDAFQAFNQMSEELMSSYLQLESQVERLNHELTERERTSSPEQALAGRLQNMLDALPGAVVVLNGKGVVELANLAAVDLLGEPLKGEQWRSVIQRAFDPRPDDGHDVSLRDGRRVSIDTNSLGHQPGQILLITDVTEKRQLQDKLGRIQRLSAMGQMAASLAHQIRTPTASALLYLSNLSRHNEDTEAVAKYSAKVRDQLQHIETLVSDMLVYAKGGSDGQPTLFTLEALSDELLQAIQSQFEQNGVTLTLENRVPELKLKGNRDALKGALINLLMNAMQNAGPAPLQVVLRFERHDAGTVAISVMDNGIGIPAQIQANVFDPFFTTRPQGTGLGLAVVKSVAEKQGGRIELVSTQGKGTTVTLLLPLQADNETGKSNPHKTKTEVRI
jgi:two-component system sensor histidine kinase FlrB